MVAWSAKTALTSDDVPSYRRSGAKNVAECVRANREINERNARHLAMLSVVPLGLAALLLATWWPFYKWQNKPLVRLLRERPLDAVWIYPHRLDAPAGR